jgi:hypothetical protein
MAITYTWELTSMTVKDNNGLSDVVFQTYWKKIGTDENGIVGTFDGATPFKPETVDSETFIPYDQLTEEIVLGWIKSIVIGPYEAHVNSQIQKQIWEKIIPITEKKTEDFPWNKK